MRRRALNLTRILSYLRRTHLAFRRDAVKLARHFSAWIKRQPNDRVPLGTTDEMFVAPTFCQSSLRDLMVDHAKIPALKCRAKFNASLRDAKCVKGAGRAAALKSRCAATPGSKC